MDSAPSCSTQRENKGPRIVARGDGGSILVGHARSNTYLWDGHLHVAAGTEAAARDVEGRRGDGRREAHQRRRPHHHGPRGEAGEHACAEVVSLPLFFAAGLR